MCKPYFAKEVDFHQTEQGPLANMAVEGFDRLHNPIEEDSEGEIQRSKENYWCIIEVLEVEGRRENLRSKG